MRIQMTDGYVSDYNNMAIFVKKLEEGATALLYYKDEKMLSVGKVVKVIDDRTIAPAKSIAYTTVDEVIDNIDNNVNYSNTAEFITNNGIFYVAVLEDIVIATDVTDNEVNIAKSQYC